MTAISQALRQRSLRLLLTASLVSLTGDWVLRVGLTYYIYALTGSTLASAVMLLASFVPQIALGSLAGVFVDRWNLRRTMIATNVLLAVGLLPLLAVHRASQVWIIYAVTAAEGCVQQFFFPAQQSILPHVTDDEHLVTANALSSQSIDVARLMGSALGGTLAAAGGITLIALADTASFAISALLVARVTVSGRTLDAGRVRLSGRLAQLRSEWSTGLALATRQRVLRVILVCVLITCVGEGIMTTLFAPFVRSVLHADVRVYGLIVAAQAAGGIAGGLLAAMIGPRFDAARTLGVAAIAFGVIDVGLVTYPLAYPEAWPAIVLMTAVGLPGALLIATAITLFQRHTETGNRGRVFGALNSAEGVTIVIGTLAAGYLGRTLGIIPMLVAQGTGYALAGMIVLVLLGRNAEGQQAARAPEAGAIADRRVRDNPGGNPG